jgi:transposase InsO family protein
MVHLTLRALAVLARLLFRSRLELVVENLALRQQLAVFKQRRPRPRLRPADRLFWVFLRRAWRHWASALLLVQADTVVGWQRQGFRWFWRLKSKAEQIGRPRIPAEVRELIRQMARDNGWGAPRIHGELLQFGFRVDERTVSRYLQPRPPAPDALQRWMAFLRNHRDCLAGMDFFTVPTATFQLLWVFFVLHHGRRRVLHFAVTDHPGAQWIVQQLREAFPFDQAPRYVICDRDGKYGWEVPAALAGLGVKPVRTAPRAPWQNGVAERWVGSVRRELLDHVVVFNRAQLHRLLAEYVRYYHEDRCHLALGKDTPDGRVVSASPSADARVVALARVGGLQHRYQWRLAA